MSTPPSTVRTMRKHLDRLSGMYAAAPVNEIITPRMSVTRGEAVVEFDVAPHMTHTAGALHAAILVKALDDAAFFAAQSLERTAFLATSELTTHLFRPVRAGTVVARGRVLAAGRRIVVAEAVATVQDRTVAHLVATLLASGTTLDDISR